MLNDEFYTPHYDLSGFAANKYGLGLRYWPVYGISRFQTTFGNGRGRRRIAKFKPIDLRYAYYQRNINFIVSFDMAFIMP